MSLVVSVVNLTGEVARGTKTALSVYLVHTVIQQCLFSHALAYANGACLHLSVPALYFFRTSCLINRTVCIVP